MGIKLAQGVSRKRGCACKIIFNSELDAVFLRRNGMATGSFHARTDVSKYSHIQLSEHALTCCLTPIFTMSSGVTRRRAAWIRLPEIRPGGGLSQPLAVELS
jgi:hypothetical protein